MSKSPTVEDVALRAGVSRQTVSNVLNSPEIVRPATRERVHAAIDELGYRPLAAARNLRTRRSSTIGIHLDPYAGGVSGVVLDRFIHALTEHAGARGMRVLVYAARTPEEEIERLADLSDSGEVDAAIITGTFHGDPRTKWLVDHGLPFVSFGRPWGEDDVADPAHLWVDVDGAAGTAQATAHALAHAGDRVGFLGWPQGSGTGDDRERGWARTGGTQHGPRLTAEDDAQQAKAVAAGVIGEVDALVCASDLLAIGAHLAATEAGRAELPIYGFDNTPAAEALGLSSVEQLPEQVAAGALELLMGPTGSVVAPRPADAGTAHVLVEPRLIVR
ncbi:LacI family DNA-binding transcriptional regulator [Microbacterium istanbulense]|uniref:LacI family DNA-binding transcriptional regulator n=1 Tax=Microbacterium istanbulense TaxID=3122049 RepID=A0ABU8LI11_9MICO